MPQYQVQKRKITMPIGTVFQTMAAQQSNWLLCNGDNVSSELYSELRGICDKVPDLRPRDANGSVIEGISAGAYIEGVGSYVPYYIVALNSGGIV